MFELIFVLIFVATLLVTGITFMTVLAGNRTCTRRDGRTGYGRSGIKNITLVDCYRDWYLVSSRT